VVVIIFILLTESQGGDTARVLRGYSRGRRLRSITLRVSMRAGLNESEVVVWPTWSDGMIEMQGA
jgi:hypothetical protein